MCKRSNSLRIDLPTPEHPDPNALAAVQEVLGGKLYDVHSQSLHVPVL